MMAGMITLVLTGLLRGIRTQRSLVFENLALRHQLAVLQRTAARPRLRTSDRLFWVLLSRPMERLGGGCLHRPTRHRDPVAADRLQARLDLEEPPERTRPPECLFGGPSAHPTNVSRQPPLGRAPDSSTTTVPEPTSPWTRTPRNPDR
jgi:hypothetical protein